MRVSFKTSLKILCIVMVVIIYITTIFLCQNLDITTNNVFSLKSIIILLSIDIFILIILNILFKLFYFPLKRIEKNMKTVIDGKIPETKHLESYSKFTETDELINSYSQMMRVIRKNNFDLDSQQSKTEIILEHMADGVIAFSISREVVHMNKIATKLLNLLPATDDNFDKIMKKLKINVDFDKVMYMPNYKTLEVKINVSTNVLNLVFLPFYSDKLIPMGVIIMVRNVTESVRLDNMRKEFVSNVSHELKTPLTSIKGYSETIMDGGLSQAEVARFSKVINQEANRMDRLVTDLLQLSRFDYKKVSFKKIMFSLEELAQNVCNKMQFAAKEKGHKLECVVTVPPPRVYADRDAIEQVIVNIISNSIKYTPQNGNIKVYLGSVNVNSAYIKIVDNGIGIPECDLQRIFERFYRVDKARSREMGGTGLGLPIVKEIIDANEGTIDISSEVNKGTEVVITLPIKIERKK